MINRNEPLVVRPLGPAGSYRDTVFLEQRIVILLRAILAKLVLHQIMHRILRPDRLINPFHPLVEFPLLVVAKIHPLRPQVQFLIPVLRGRQYVGPSGKGLAVTAGDLRQRIMAHILQVLLVAGDGGRGVIGLMQNTVVPIPQVQPGPTTK